MTNAIDTVLTHQWLGFPVLILFMWVMFQATFSLGSYPMDWIQEGVDGLGNWIAGSMPAGPLDVYKRQAQDGVFVYIPEGVNLKRPLQIVNLLRAKADLMAYQRNMIILEKGAEATLLVCDHTLSENYFLMNNVTEIYVGEGAHLDYYQVQDVYKRQSLFKTAKATWNLKTLSSGKWTELLYWMILSSSVNTATPTVAFLSFTKSAICISISFSCIWAIAPSAISRRMVRQLKKCFMFE